MTRIIEIKKATPHEAGEIYAEGKAEPRFLGFWPRECLEKAVGDPNVFFYSARVNNSLAGFALASYAPTLRKTNFENLYVNPEYRRIIHNKDSLSGQLVKRIVDESIMKGALYLTCNMEEDNTKILKRIKHEGFEICQENGVAKKFLLGYRILGVEDAS
jgi:hypothetical protein